MLRFGRKKKQRNQVPDGLFVKCDGCGSLVYRKNVEERLHTKEEELDRRLTELSRREQGLHDRELHVRELQDDLKKARERELAELQRISGMTVDEAKRHVLQRSEELIRHDLARQVRQE